MILHGFIYIIYTYDYNLVMIFTFELVMSLLSSYVERADTLHFKSKPIISIVITILCFFTDEHIWKHSQHQRRHQLGVHCTLSRNKFISTMFL